MFPPLGAQTPASRILRISSFGTGSGLSRRIERVVRMISNGSGSTASSDLFSLVPHNWVSRGRPIGRFSARDAGGALSADLPLPRHSPGARRITSALKPGEVEQGGGDHGRHSSDDEEVVNEMSLFSRLIFDHFSNCLNIVKPGVFLRLRFECGSTNQIAVIGL